MSNDFANARCNTCGSLTHFTEDHRPRPDGPGAPAPEPPKHSRLVEPKTRTAPEVTQLLDDVLALCGAEVRRLTGLSRGGTGLTAGDAKALEAIARTIKLTHDLDRDVRRGLEEEFGKQPTEVLEAERARLRGGK